MDITVVYGTAGASSILAENAMQTPVEGRILADAGRPHVIWVVKNPPSAPSVRLRN